jgi:hypothetical protein
MDGDVGQVYIYIGGAFPAGTNLSTFKYLFDHTGPGGNTSGYITPLLFTREVHETSVLYTVAGIGRGFTVDCQCQRNATLQQFGDGRYG